MAAQKSSHNPLLKVAVKSTSARIPRVSPPADRTFTFSFTYWKQAEHFGLKCEKVNDHWFASLLEQLSTLSKEKVEDVTGSRGYSTKKDYFRWHPVNWGAKNIPIKKSDITWLGRDVNIDELEIVQFQLSKDNGRVFGFLDADNVFCVLLLDPMHNLQPSKDVNYNVRPTAILRTEHEIQKTQFMELHAHATDHCKQQQCRVQEHLAVMLNAPPEHRYFCIDDEFKALLEQIMANGDFDSIDFAILEALEHYIACKGLGVAARSAAPSAASPASTV